jgi:hypothetical protein
MSKIEIRINLLKQVSDSFIIFETIYNTPNMPFNSIFGWLMKKRIHQIDLFRKYPIEVQKECFEYLLAEGKTTQFGKEHSFSNIENYEDFKKTVPLSNYEVLKNWVAIAMKGKPNILWPGETKWFAKSSGTTSDRSKLIPVTKNSLEDCHYKGGKDLLAIYYDQHPNSKLYKGKHLVVGGSAEHHALREDSYTGDLSAIILKNLPWWAEIKRTPSKEIALMSEWDEKIEKLAQSTMKEDVYSISGVPSWTMVLMHRILSITGAKNILEIWPNLELFMHGGVSFEPYREEFKKLIPSEKMNYIESYNASEGFFGIQDNQDGDLLLMLDYGIFYEFIPMSDFRETASENVISLEDVELNKNYAIVISTNGGLWRYIIGDTIQFTSKTPYRFRVSGRTKHFINTFGEELIVENAEQAISEACKATNANIRDYTACPIFMKDGDSGGHEWLIEFNQPPKDIQHFMRVLDNTLRAINSDYDAKRTNDLTLVFPKLNILDSGTFENWLRTKGKLGGQHKVPRLSNDRAIVEEVLSLSNGMVLDAVPNNSNV